MAAITPEMVLKEMLGYAVPPINQTKKGDTSVSPNFYYKE